MKANQTSIARDRIKQEICDRQKIALITIRPEDLTFQRMREILGKVLPLSDVSEDEPIVAFLESKSRSYLESIEKIRRQSDPKSRRER